MIRSSFNHPTTGVQRDFLLAFYQAVTVTLASTAFYAGYKIAQNPARYTFCFYSDESRKHAVAGEGKSRSRSLEPTYRDEIYSLQNLLSRTQAGPGRTVKKEQEEISPNHVQRINLISVFINSVAANWLN